MMHARFESPLTALMPDLAQTLAPILAAPGFSGALSAAQVAELMAAGKVDEEDLCLALLPVAAACALTPVSHFNVGAIVSGVSGNLYFGANMEITGVSLSQTVHAEQSAINHAWLRGEHQLRGITVNYSPCGHCRQFMNELNSGADLLIHLPARAPASLGHYLPDAFGPKDLDIKTLLMDQVDHHYSVADTPQPVPHELEPLLQQALQAANQSHAPYSLSHSGVALQLTDGRIFAGRYAENAAFNPSLPPLQSALILLNMAGGDCHAIKRAILVERANVPLAQWDVTVATLRALGCEESYRYFLAE
jgi:cytidine deaminase